MMSVSYALPLTMAASMASRPGPDLRGERRSSEPIGAREPVLAEAAGGAAGAEPRVEIGLFGAAVVFASSASRILGRFPGRQKPRSVAKAAASIRARRSVPSRKIDSAPIAMAA